MLLPLAMFLGQTMTSNDLRRTYAAGDKDAVMMLPPETVCGSDTTQFTWSADGTYLVAVRRVEDVRPSDLKAAMEGRATPEMAARAQRRTELVVWGAQSHKARTVLTLAGPMDHLDDLEAMPGSDRIVFVAYETVPGQGGTASRESISIVLLSPAAGTMTRLVTQDAQDAAGYMLSSKRPLGALMGVAHDGKNSAIRFFGPTGELSAPYSISRPNFFTFNEQGVPGLFSVNRDGPKTVRQFQTIDPRTGALGTPIVQPRPPVPMKVPTPPIDALFATVTLPKGFAAPTIMLALPGGKPEEAGVVTTDGEEPKVAPTLDAVAYKSGGSLVVRPFAKVPRKAYEEALLARARGEALAKAKQVGLGIIMYASDMDDMYPNQNADLRSLIGPYLLNNSVFEGFNYTFKGGAMTSIESPAETEMGYVNGPGGRAVVYTDGHVRWRPNAP